MSGQTSSAEMKKNQVARSGQHGGPRPNSGRKPGKSSAPLREIARQHMEKAVNALLNVLDDVEAPAAARVSAANSILDRGYGKPAQPVDGDGEGGAIRAVHEIILRGVMPK
jgi:hypothetical protein